MARLISVLLTETQENLGIIGDVVKVRAGYARNYLLPFGLVTNPTEEKIAALAARRAEVEAELKRLRVITEGVFAKVKETTVEIVRATNDQGQLFGGISQHDIAESLRKAGHEGIEDRHVRVGAKMTRVDTYFVPVQLAKDLKTEIKVIVKSDRVLAYEAAEAAAKAAKAAEVAKLEGKTEEKAEATEAKPAKVKKEKAAK